MLFGSVHLPSGDLAVAGLLAFLGVILAWLYERTGSLGPPIVLHMVNNSIAIIPLLVGLKSRCRRQPCELPQLPP